eukprot:gnl/Spiro4/24454_TR12122_c0_g1_i1.p1 gnl/Spiro4/24454_TR12122_c0_g1~~gnl/Spiro4/24454_TR12122_c0_g1_i1.p1  ORF type:complete len:125 (-),score=19.03 gnl/Spiro4/24454_TR12122_c0_g1_i1:72-446(-)
MATPAAAPKAPKKPSSHEGRPVRLFSKGVVTGFRRSKVNQYPDCALIKIQGVNQRSEVPFYLGKRIAYVYKGKTLKNGTKIRVIWGRVKRAHGNSGLVRCGFRKNLPPKCLGGNVRIMLYPSNI